MYERYTLKDYLIASPYNMDTNFKGELTEEIFYDKYFIIPSSYEKLSKLMDSIFDSTTQFLPASLFLYGYSGIGKTTYLRWYMQKLKNYNKIFFDLADDISEDGSFCIIDSSQEDNSIKLFSTYFSNISCKFYHKYPDAINKLLRWIFNSRLNMSNTFTIKFYEDLENYLNSKKGKTDATAFIKLIYCCKYRDLFTLLLFLYFSYPDEFTQFFKEKDDFRKAPYDRDLPLLIIFDNIDHIEIEHHNSEFPKIIESIYHNVKQIIRKEMKNNIMNDTIHFIFCLRDANCSLINCQLADLTIRNKIQFIPPENESKIFEQRISIAERSNVKLNSDDYEFLNYILNDEYTKKSFQPLFNYNIRKFAEFVCGIIQESDSTYVNEIKKLYKVTRYGSRGIEYYLIIKHLLNEDYLKGRLFLTDETLNGANKDFFINPVRILLTNILNKSRYSLNFQENYDVGLYSLFTLFEEIFEKKVDLYFEILTNLFLIHKGNWCHLITFSNKQVFSENNFKEEKLILNSLVKNQKVNNLPKVDYLTEINKLNKIRVSLNPAGFVYIRDITKHYEFFSIRADNNKPLFCSLDPIWIGNYLDFSFTQNIKYTYRLVEECVENLIDFLYNYTNGNFSSSAHCFRTYDDIDKFGDEYHENKRPGLHSVRLIDTHIEYIDAFRIFILNDNDFTLTLKNELSKVGKSDIIELKRSINKKLLDSIERYVTLLKRIHVDGGVGAHNEGYSQLLSEYFESKLHSIKRSDYYDFHTRINQDRKDFFKRKRRYN